MANVLTGAGRLGRMNTFLIQVGACTAMVASVVGVVLVFPATQSASGEAMLPPAAMPPLLLISAVCTWLTYGALVCRCHDRGHKGTFVLWLLVPVLGMIAALYLMFAPGEPMSNRYGRPPRDSKMTDQAYQERNMSALNKQVDRTTAPTKPSYVNADGSYDMDGLFK